jgi:hypothetical protein
LSLGAWGGGLIFTAYDNYDHAWKIGVLGFSAGVLQILAGGLRSSATSSAYHGWRQDSVNDHPRPLRARHIVRHRDRNQELPAHRRLDCARHHILSRFWSARLDLVRCKRRESRTAGILHGIWLSFFS